MELGLIASIWSGGVQRQIQQPAAQARDKLKADVFSRVFELEFQSQKTQ
jgi:hypothetical protein